MRAPSSSNRPGFLRIASFRVLGESPCAGCSLRSRFSTSECHLPGRSPPGIAIFHLRGPSAAGGPPGSRFCSAAGRPLASDFPSQMENREIFHLYGKNFPIQMINRAVFPLSGKTRKSLSGSDQRGSCGYPIQISLPLIAPSQRRPPCTRTMVPGLICWKNW